MKINEILNEYEVKPYSSKEVNTDKIMAFLQKNCSDAIPMIHNPIWRGMKDQGDTLVINPTTGVRSSHNTSNHYTLLMDNSPYMKGWPKRSKSLICSTSRGYASNYSDRLYAIFPFDGVKIGVCPGQDIWGTSVDLSKIIPGLDETREFDAFNGWLSTIGIPDDSFAAMVSAAKSKDFVNHVNARYEVNMKPGEFIPKVQAAIAPAAVGFKLATTAQLAQSMPENNEVWVGGKVLAIRGDIWRTLIIPNK